MATHIKNSLSRSSHRSSGKTGAFAAMLIVVLASAMLLCAAGCNPKAAWSDTGGDQVGVKSVVTCFVYDPTHDILYAGTEGEGLCDAPRPAHPHTGLMRATASST